MAVAEWSDDEDHQLSVVPLDLFPVMPLIQEHDLSMLITDFFDWLETAWQLPLFQPDVVRPPLPLPLTLTEEQYTIPDLARLCGCTFDWLYRYVERFQIVSPGYVPYLSPTGTKGQCRAFRKEDLVLFLEQWEWKRLTQVLDQWWLRFFPPACGTCYSCRRGGRSPMAQQFFCSGCVPLNNLRIVFTHFLRELRHLGSVTAWWQEHQTDTWTKTICFASGILVIYLLDRRLVHLSLDELIQFAPVSHKDHHELTRLWRNRRPEEYAQFLFFWRYADSLEQKGPRPSWGRGPHGWELMLVRIVEQALAAPVYEHTTAIISRRPETEPSLLSPWFLAHQGKLTDTGYALLPATVQEHMMIYLTYCHQEQQMELTTLRTRTRDLISFFTWLRRQGKLVHYPHFSREGAQEIFREYASLRCAEMTAASRRTRFTHLAHFFATLADLEYPVPAGYRLLYILEKHDPHRQRAVPREEIMDRVFRDGVCRLSYDPLSRLALTIQYYYGTRVSETCDLHLFCVLEDRDGHISLLVPKGKSKEERPFPIVELGMGPLLEYMDEAVALRLSPDGTSRTLGKTNFRYLDDDPERARDWHYLFDRTPGTGNTLKKRGCLSSGRVGNALAEALHIAARANPDGLFQLETYQHSCRHRRRKGQRCLYFAATDGVTICPCCGSPLSGKLGAWCNHVLKEDFICDGEALSGEIFCPKCEAPLATFLPITTHIFRHNSVSRAHRAGVSLAHNMRLHGHQTVPMHLRYLHLLLEDTTDEVRQIFVEKRLRDVRQALGSTPGQIVEGGIAYTVSLEHYLGITLQRALKRRTYGIWGGFWAGALAQRGVASPLTVEDEIVIPEDTYEHTVAQYWYEALGLAVSEVAFEHVTGGKWRPEVPLFLDRHKIEALVQFHLRHIQDSLGSALGVRLMETDILEQRRFLDELAEKLRPWWQHLGTIDQLVELFAPGGGHAFQKQLPPTEPAS